MPRHKKDPSYRLHKQSGQAIVTLPDGLGGRKDFLLGPYGSEASNVEYHRLLAEWRTNGRRPPEPVASASDLSINELVLRFWEQKVTVYYRQPDGSPGREQENYKYSLRPLKHLYGNTPARQFGPSCLEAVRDLMIRGYDHPEFGPQVPLARGVINQRVGRVRRLFQWAVAKELLDVTVYQKLLAVEHLQLGRSDARETAPVGPVAPHVVEATLPFLSRQVADMVRLQLLTGMRPGEVVILRGVDLDTRGHVWHYRPTHHKMAYRGQSREIAIGPQGQAILKSWLRPNVTEYLFQPRDAMATFRAEQRRQRKTKVQPSQQQRHKARPKKKPRERYDSRSYAQAITKGIAKANTARACEQCKPVKPAKRCQACKAAALPHWHPHQLRHTRATELRSQLGPDVARAVLGHASLKATEVYAEVDLGKATEAMAKLG